MQKKVDTIANRIRTALDIRNMKQADLVEKTKIGKSIKDAVIKIMSWGYSDEDKYDLLKDISKAEQERKEEKGGKTK